MNEEEKKVRLEKLTLRRLDKLRWLKSCCEQVIECATDTLKKIEAEGLNNNYSCNHDIQKWSERIHRTSYELWLLTDVQRLAEEGIETVEVMVEEEPEKKQIVTVEKIKNETS